MQKGEGLKDKIVMTVFIVVLGASWTLALVGVDLATRDRIEAYQRGQIRESVLTALGIDCEGRDIDGLFKADVSEAKVDIDGSERTVYRVHEYATLKVCHNQRPERCLQSYIAASRGSFGKIQWADHVFKLMNTTFQFALAPDVVTHSNYISAGIG